MGNPYDVEFTDVALKNLGRYPKADQRRILERIDQLAADPLNMPNVKRLVDYDVAYRMRAGDYRVLFERDDAIRVVNVIDILGRAEASWRR